MLRLLPAGGGGGENLADLRDLREQQLPVEKVVLMK